MAGVRAAHSPARIVISALACDDDVWADLLAPYYAHRNRKKNRQQSQGDPAKATNADVKPADRRANSVSSRRPSAAPSVAPSEAPAAEAAATAPPAESPAPSTGVVAAVTHAAEAAFTAVSAAAEKVVSLANGPVDDAPPPETDASEAVTEAADNGDSALEARDAANGVTPQQTDAGTVDAAPASELLHPDAAEESDDVIVADEAPADGIEEHKLPWSQPAAPPTDQAQRDKCAVSPCSTRALMPIGHMRRVMRSAGLMYTLEGRPPQPCHCAALDSLGLICS